MALMVIVTIPQAQAQKIAQSVLKKKLAACANIIKGVKSLFWWQGKIDKAKESIIIFKTTIKLFEPLKRHIKRNHPYQVPEIVAFKIFKGNKEYLAWIAKSCY